MFRRLALLTLAAILTLCVPAQSDPTRSIDVADALNRLSAASAVDRAAAERELAQLLTASDAGLLIDAARAGSAEVRSRISSALTSRARHFGLAAALAASADQAVARTGAEALSGHAAAWLGAGDQEPLPMATLEREIRGAFGGLWQLDPRQGSLEVALDRIARLVDSRRVDQSTGARAWLVLDPRFDPSAARPLVGAEEIPSPVIGSFEDLVYAVAVLRGSIFDVYGWDEGQTWFLVRPLDGSPPPTAQALLQGWVLAVEKPASPQAARHAARAIAATGWPAALDWLDWRWRERQDPAAFDALVLAAGRGAVASSLACTAGAEKLLQEADRALASEGEPSPQARELARALLAIGSLGRDAWSSGFENAPARAKNLRCALVRGARLAPTELMGLLGARWLAPQTSPEDRCATLRALAALGVERRNPIEPGPLESAFNWAAHQGWGREFAANMGAIGCGEPLTWRQATHLSVAAQSDLCADALARAATDADALTLAGERILSLLAQPRGEEILLSILDRESLWTTQPILRQALLAARGGGAAAATIARLMACIDVATGAELEQLGAEVFSRETWSDADWRSAGATIARAGGALDLWPRRSEHADAFYAEFLARLERVRGPWLGPSEDEPAWDDPRPGDARDARGMDAGWVQGCERALRLLRVRQSEPGAREFLRRLRVLFQRSRHPLRLELSGGRFPPASPSVLVDLDLREPWIGF